MITIHNDQGGVVTQYEERADRYRGQRMVVDGRCASACTVYLSNPNLCATGRAQFWFHSAYLVSPMGWKILDPNSTATMLGYYPPAVLKFIQKYRPYGLNGQWLVLKGAEMKSIVPQCRKAR